MTDSVLLTSQNRVGNIPTPTHVSWTCPGQNSPDDDGTDVKSKLEIPVELKVLSVSSASCMGELNSIPSEFPLDNYFMLTNN